MYNTRMPDLSIFQRVGRVENDPSKGAGCKIQCAAFKAGGDIHGSILCLLVYIVAASENGGLLRNKDRWSVQRVR